MVVCVCVCVSCILACINVYNGASVRDNMYQCITSTMSRNRFITCIAYVSH